DHPSVLRAAHAHPLLYKTLPDYAYPPPTSWLTLRDSQGNWQMGVDGDVTLQQLPASSICPLPKLLQSRCFSPALCGFAFDQQQLVLLLDGRKLTPEPLAHQP
ncbi:MAG TPA: hypothetical protein VLO13_10335, partial [Halomonas sp.]|nr:hypothetical protein [Halomonas sp.]